MARDCCRCAPHTQEDPSTPHPSTGETPQPREGLAGFYRATDSSRCFLQVMLILPIPSRPVGPPLALHQLAGGAEQFDRCRRGFVYIQQTALYSQSHGRRIPPLLTLWCQRGKWVSSKVGISARVGSQAAQPPDIPSLRHSPFCHWSERQ